MWSVNRLKLMLMRVTSSPGPPPTTLGEGKVGPGGQFDLLDTATVKHAHDMTWHVVVELSPVSKRRRVTMQRHEEALDVLHAQSAEASFGIWVGGRDQC